MNRCLRSYPFRLFAFLVLLLGQMAWAAKEEWSDTQNNKFKGEASQVFGPFAIFKTGSITARRVLLSQLPEDQCVRFAQRLAKKAPRAACWADAGSDLSVELKDCLTRVDAKGFVRIDTTNLPEPELYLVIYATSGNGDCWRMLGKTAQALKSLSAEFPGMIEGIFLGYGHDASAQHDMPKTMGWPGIVPERNKSPRGGLLSDYFGGTNPGVIVLTREGLPIVGCEGESDEDIAKMAAKTREFLSLATTENPKAWPARAYYARAVRPVLHANQEVGPLMLGNPLRSDGLVQRGVRYIDANLKVDAAGNVTAVDFLQQNDMPEPLKVPLAEALQKGCPMLPALNKGVAVEGNYHFQFDLRRASAKTTLADLRGFREIPINSWLVLRPIRVSTLPVLAGGANMLEDGSVLMTPVYVGANLKGAPPYKEQRRAFLTDWFDGEEGGVATVLPTSGKTEYVWGEKYTWTVMEAPGGMLNLQAGELNWVIAYAYAEIDSPVEGLAYFGMGSDDAARVWVNGVKVHETWANRAVQPNQDIFPARLVAGKNKILVKVQNFLMPQWGLQLQAFVPNK